MSSDTKRQKPKFHQNIGLGSLNSDWLVYLQHNFVVMEIIKPKYHKNNEFGYLNSDWMISRENNGKCTH